MGLSLICLHAVPLQTAQPTSLASSTWTGSAQSFQSYGTFAIFFIYARKHLFGTSMFIENQVLGLI